jgi:tetratricopeptide (TPR) repeat protein
MATLGKSGRATVMIVLLLAGVAALAYVRSTRSITEADRALAAGQWETALAAYQGAERQFDRISALKPVVASDYNRVVGNELWLLYRLQRYDEAIEKAERAPEMASPHRWSGLALFAKSRAETNPQGQLGWLTRSEEELRRAVEAAPNDWDTKYDFELVTRLAAELRKQPKTPPNQLMQLLRPQPKPGAKPVRRVG